MSHKFLDGLIKVVVGDITAQRVDAIVNAANSSLMGGGGVDGAIHRAGGPLILEQCKAIRNQQGECPPGEAVITTGGNLKASFVIHTVGPVWNGGNRNEDLVLAKAYRSSLALALKNNISTIAFPNISTGIYGFPKERAAVVVLKEVRDFLKENNRLKKIIFCCFDEENHRIYSQLLKA